MSRLLEEFEHCLKNSNLDVKHMKISQRNNREYFEGFFPNGQHVFIKLQTSDSGKSKIDLEQKIYNSLGYNTYVIPGCEKFTYMASEYLDGYITLMDVIKSATIDTDNKGRYLVKSFQEYIRMLNCIINSNIILQEENWYKLFRRTSIKLLMSSGWDGVNGVRRIIREYYVSACVIFVELLIKIGVIKMKKTQMVSHGDLHWKNIMCKDEEVCILDLENTAVGDPNIDIAFLYARLWYYLRKDAALSEQLETAVNCFKNTKYYEKKTFDRLSTLFKLFVRVNPRFR